MGLFSSKKSKTTVNENYNIDDSQNISGSDVHILESGAILADEVNRDDSVFNTSKSASENVSVAGEGNVFNQFSEQAASAVNKAIDTLGNITETNIQGRNTEILKDEIRKKNPVESEQLKQFFSSAKGVYFIGGMGALMFGIFYYAKKKGAI